MKYMTVLASLLAVSVAFAAETEPIYVFDIAAETAIDAATVKYVTGGETNEVEFSTLPAPTTGTIVKLGEGRLNSSATLANFVGEVQVREGEFALTGVGQIGNAENAHATVTVSDGASFVTATAKAKVAPYLEVSICGKGYQDKGAIRDESTVSAGTAFENAKWTLAGDTEIHTANTDRFGLSGSAGVLDLNGHVLTIVNDSGKSTAEFVFDSCTVTNPPSGEAIVVKSGRFFLQLAPKFEGDASNVLKITGTADMRGYWARMEKFPWTVECRDGMDFVADGKYVYDEYDGTDNFFNAPFNLLGSLNVKTESSYAKTFGQGLDLRGPVSGSGGLYVSGRAALMLENPNNSFGGAVGITGSSYTNHLGQTCYPAVTLTANGAAPESCAGLAVTNANLRLTGREVYQLPKTDLSASSAVSGLVSMTGGEPGSTVKSLGKVGVGEMIVKSPVTVEDTVDVARGRLTMPLNRRAGLIFAQGTKDDFGETSLLNFVKAKTFFTNDVRRSVHFAYSDIGKSVQSKGFMWNGYIWNRSPTNERWTVVSAMNYYYNFRFDGTRMFTYDQYMGTRGRAVKVTLENVTPGPHMFTIKAYAAGSEKNSVFPVNPTNLIDYADLGDNDNADHYVPLAWTDNFGVAIDRKGRDSTNWEDYEKIEDPGDGSFITVSADGSLPDLETFDCATINKLKIGTQGEAELNAMGGDLTLASLEGVGTIVNESYFTNTVTVTGEWKVKTSQIAAGRKLYVQQGKLVFGDGATLTLDADKKLAGNTNHVIAEADEGIEGVPTLSGEAIKKGWLLVVSADGKTLSVRHDAGCIILFR